MHENQLTYPPPPGSKRDLTYGMIQHLSMLAADRVFFNSAYHLRSWFGELPRLLRHFPDYGHLESVEATRRKSNILPVGCDLRSLDEHRTATARRRPAHRPVEPALGVRQRPGDHAPRTLYTRRAGGRIPGGAGRRELPRHAGRVRRGPRTAGQPAHPLRLCADAKRYARLLWEANAALSTAIHEFFGVGVVEALYCGCSPVLPARLSYPELVPPELHERCLYTDFDGLIERLRSALVEPCPAALREWVSKFDWGVVGEQYDTMMAELF